MLLSLTFIPPIFVEFLYQDGFALTFHLSFAVTFGLGFLLWFPLRTRMHALRAHDGFLIVLFFWLTASIIGALPLYWNVDPSLSFTDAFFESVSGLTTTGSTIFNHIDNLPHALLYYRQQLQFIGGISIVVLAVAILPALGIGGMQLFRTEVTGPVKDDKLTPRVTHSAKAIWLLYVFITALCVLSYYLAGMPFFDALVHSFSTVSTGGFSTHNQSLAFYDSAAIESVAMVFMLLGAISFNLHFLLLKNQKLRVYFNDPEFILFAKIILSITVLIWVALVIAADHKNSPYLLFDSLFQVISMATTTGFLSSDFSLWPLFVGLLLLFCGVIGGCAGSTSGGIKTVRVLLLQKQGAREIKRLVHPHGQYVIKLGDKAITPRIIEAIWGFFAIYFVMFTVLLLLLLIFEQDFFTAYSALLATLSNTGPGLGHVSTDFSALNPYAKWILSFAMLAGRLEIFTILVLLSPAFWRR
ncbi:MAG: TrkH family potassium uptake protein [Candidatus Berkiella sp.]